LARKVEPQIFRIARIAQMRTIQERLGLLLTADSRPLTS